MHVFGQTDAIIPRSMSESLASTFDDPLIVTHPGGHYFPATANQKKIYIDYLSDRLVDFLEQKELEEAGDKEVKTFAGTSDESDWDMPFVFFLFQENIWNKIILLNLKMNFESQF